MNTRQRKRIAKGIYRDGIGLAPMVKVGTGQAARQRGKRFAFDTPLRDIKAWQNDTRLELGRSIGRTPDSTRGTLAHEAAAI
jgi:hypothetical protein